MIAGILLMADGKSVHKMAVQTTYENLLLSYSAATRPWHFLFLLNRPRGYTTSRTLHTIYHAQDISSTSYLKRGTYNNELNIARGTMDPCYWVRAWSLPYWLATKTCISSILAPHELETWPLGSANCISLTETWSPGGATCITILRGIVLLA